MLQRLQQMTLGLGAREEAERQEHDKMPKPPLKVSIIGSGNWGCTAGILVAENCAEKPKLFKEEVLMWVHEEEVEGRKLTEIMNTDHENVKYLPGVKLPKNIVAESDLATACKGADVLIFVVPHQFLEGLLPTIKENMAKNAIAISLIKGIDFDESGIVLVSDVIRKGLGIEVSALMGANVASEIADGDFAEATIGGPAGHARVLQEVFHRPKFHVTTVRDSDAVELCGALKNIVALGAGFCDGLGYGNNAKAAIIRIGLLEIGRFIELRSGEFPTEILLQSCGAADLITTCYGGRNRKCAEAFVAGSKNWEEIEADLLGGQKLQGTLTCAEVFKVLAAEFPKGNADDHFPLFCNIHRIAFEGAKPETIFDGLSKSEKMLEEPGVPLARSML
ncbi:Glycerol-3-phosphate dehydrogenase NAD+ [Hondaea fermentalgiana]|uniref:Glycerol-3-phosphate dehydrogenase [NAD(+)] n=1 Tax=Hondaea fermentalgiana TaxID=2315210 RepID=A0A2R5GA10_9STRA|nr:Glycerol-3-phosphate dehydrogenase NAD+ [Hondaea fermentalgiana]|eukprot:GBG26568.1 Glycerol-3-phosphate dehydrogenase NAD+ [Hondaea fermentalgiana]